jgi:hypothetical protein
MIRLGQTRKAFEVFSLLAVALLACMAGSTVEPEAMAQTIGGSMIGKLQGPEVITNPTQFPKTFQEAPQLAELVKAGTLPPVTERLGQDPLVIKPVHEIGKYGGTWRRASPASRQIQRLQNAGSAICAGIIRQQVVPNCQGLGVRG